MISCPEVPAPNFWAWAKAPPEVLHTQRIRSLHKMRHSACQPPSDPPTPFSSQKLLSSPARNVKVLQNNIKVWLVSPCEHGIRIATQDNI
eukprot:2408988-Amphidinium_carterae.1